jgi:ERCC4-related helicase
MWQTMPVELTPQQAKFFAHELTLRRASDDSSKLTTALMDAQVDLNPHQVDAALFGFRSPFSKGAILADEVGLGKTIEAGLVLTQKWAEGKRRILVVTPASLRKQWVQELADKFFLPSVILESKSYNEIVKAGRPSPFEQPSDEQSIVICSFQFAARKSEDLMILPWDLVVIDEAHRLRNVYKPGNKVASALRTALENVPKLLLTATPLQNSLMELYGLVSIIDPHTFGDAKSFRRLYSRLTTDETFDDLKARLAPLCHRTLRRQVVEYIRYTNRVPLTQDFIPTEDEQALYDMVSEYLRRPSLQALPSGQRTLMILVMRKLLASSTFAIAGALGSLIRKLETLLRDDAKSKTQASREVVEELSEDYEELAEQADEWDSNADEEATDDAARKLSDDQVFAIRAEIDDLIVFRDLAVSITENAKGEALLQALDAGFAKARQLGSAEKVIIFTESRRTQDYLVRLLSEHGYADQLVLFNGSNSDPASSAIYKEWVQQNRNSDRVTGSRTADMRSALVDRFRSTSSVMIATEAAAEGINLQFCSMVVNYDLPWNPQRIEQRIGRCHRYGQQHDVVVINFLNRANAADQRVFELLAEKFQLFSGVFGASDEVLGAIESGVDFEKRITAIYQECRTTEEIESGFTQLQLELEDDITATMDDTRKKLLENFDAEVHDRLRVNLAESREYLSRGERLLWEITRLALSECAVFRPDVLEFDLTSLPDGCTDVALGTYRLGRAEPEEPINRYRPGHPLAKFVIQAACERDLDDAQVEFDYTGWAAKADSLRPLVGQAGTLVMGKVTIVSAETEDHLIIAAATDGGTKLTADQVRRMFDLPASVEQQTSVKVSPQIVQEITLSKDATLRALSERQANWFEEEMDKLDRWADDKREGLRGELREIDEEIKDLKRQARQAANLPEKLGLQRKVKGAEAKRDDSWRAYDGEARGVEHAKEELIDRVEQRLGQHVSDERLFTIRWRLT